MNKTTPILLSILMIVALGGLALLMTKINPATDTNNNINLKLETNKQQEKIMDTKKTEGVILKTNQGDIKIELFVDKTPKTVANFIKLAEAGFYDGVRFHRVIKDFMIQSGDPLSKDVANKSAWGTGGPGYKFEDEFAEGLSNVAGTISMANSGPNTNGSQFFINVNNNSYLDGRHSVFGKVIEGIEIVNKIENTVTGPNDVPLEDMIINSIEVY